MAQLLLGLYRLNYFTELAEQKGLEAYRNSAGDHLSDVELIRFIKEGHAVQQYLTWMHNESATLDLSGDSEQQILET